ncbi:MAG: hypothetical protein WBA10_15630 [Elainellaceae cyanobacterium]
MFSTLLGIILIPATFAFILGFAANVFKAQANYVPPENSESGTIDVGEPAATDVSVDS